jgi:LPS export ABC transporter protein LptC
MIDRVRQALLRSRERWIGLGAILVLLLPSACTSPSQAPANRKETGRSPVQSFENMELRETSDGKLEWILRAKRATRDAVSEPTRLDSLRVDFYQGTDRVRSVLTSDSGRVDTQKGVLIAMGRVVVVTREGSRLETEELSWNRKTARVSSEQFVRLIRGRDVLTGTGFRSDPNLVSYEILKDVRASVREETGIRDEFFGADSAGAGR